MVRPMLRFPKYNTNSFLFAELAKFALFLQGKAIDEATTKPESGTLRPKKRNVSLDIFDERQLRKSSRKITEKLEIYQFNMIVMIS